MHGVNALTIAGFANRRADGLAAFANARLADVAADLIRLRANVRLTDGPAAALDAVLDAGLTDLTADRARHFAIASLADRAAAGLGNLAALGSVDRAINGVPAFLHDGLRDRAADGPLLGAPFGLVARAIAGSLLFAEASFADGLHHCFASGLVADVEAPLGHDVPNQAVAGAALVLASAEAALGVASRPVKYAESRASTIARLNRGRAAQQADDRERRTQRQSQSHPHDTGLLNRRRDAGLEQ